MYININILTENDCDFDVQTIETLLQIIPLKYLGTKQIPHITVSESFIFEPIILKYNLFLDKRTLQQIS